MIESKLKIISLSNFFLEESRFRRDNLCHLFHIKIYRGNALRFLQIHANPFLSDKIPRAFRYLRANK